MPADDGSSSISDLFDRLEEVFQSAHDAAPSVWIASQRMWDQVDQMTREVYARVTQSGSLVPSMPPILQKDAVPPLPPPSPTNRSHSWLPLPRFRTVVIGGCAILTTGLVLDAVLPPHTLRRLFAHPTIRSALPASVLPRLPPPTRPRRTSDGSGRLEAVLVLGADPGTPGATIARDLARKGFVVLASVRRTSSVKGLEKDGRGWIKVLVLDPTESNSFAPFIRSVTASLSLRFPLHSPGDAFVSDGLALSLTGLVNALPLSVDPFERMRPVEAVELDELEQAMRETAGSAASVVKAVLPMMRTAAGRPDSPDAVILTLLPSATTSLSLPFHSVSSTANQALESLMTSLKRELASAESTGTTGRVRIITDRVGDLRPTPKEAELAIGLPHHLHALYAPALARRLPPPSSTSSRSQVPALARLSSRVLSILLDPRPRPFPRSSAGPGSWTYRVVGWLPNFVVDTWLVAVEGVARWAARHDTSSADPSSRVTVLRAPGAGPTRRPLPTPPIPRTTSQAGSSSEASGDETFKRSGVVGGSGNGDSSEGEQPTSMAESFVGSEEDWRAHSEEEHAKA